MRVETTHHPGPLRQDVIRGAIEANMEAYWLSLARPPRGVLSDGPDLKWAYTGAPVLNRVAGARLAEATADDRIAEVVRRFRDWKAGVTWLTGPADHPADLQRRLQAHGFSYEGEWTGMALDLTAHEAPHPRPATAPAPATPTGLAIVRADAGETRRAWLAVIATAFRLPRAAQSVFRHLPEEPAAEPEPERDPQPGLEPGRGRDPDPGLGRVGGTVWRRYVGFAGGRPVAAATLVAAGGTAGVYLVGTLPRARGQGFGAALTRHVLDDARGRGYRLAVLQATTEGRGLYRRLGFVEYSVIGVYRWAPPGRGPRSWLTRLRGRVGRPR